MAHQTNHLSLANSVITTSHRESIRSAIKCICISKRISLVNTKVRKMPHVKCRMPKKSGCIVATANMFSKLFLQAFK